jgi:transcriptional regulator with XRE-family HTH domain
MTEEMHNKEDGKQRLAENVRRTRKLLGMTQADLAESSGVGQDTISLIENGKTTPNCFDVANIAEALNTTTEMLLKPVLAARLQKVY